MKQIVLTQNLVLTPHRLPFQHERQIKNIVKTIEKMLKAEPSGDKCRE